MQQVAVHEGFDPGHQQDRVGVDKKRERGGNPQMIDDGNEGWGRSQ